MRIVVVLTAGLLVAGTSAEAQVHLWSRSFGNANAAFGAFGFAVTVDPQGGVFLVGRLENSVDFGGGLLVPAGSSDVFIARFDPAGRHLWSRRYGDAGSQAALGVAACPDGSIVVAGWFLGTLDLGGGPLVAGASQTAFVAKLGPWGEEIWSHAYGGATGYAVAFAVGVGPTGRVAVTGICGGAIDFGGGLQQAHNVDGFAVHLDAAGRFQASATFFGLELRNQFSVAIDAVGNVYVTGETQWFTAPPPSLPPTCVPAVGVRASVPAAGAGTRMPEPADHQIYAYILRMTPQGQIAWFKMSPPNGCASGAAVALDRTGEDLVVAGSFCNVFDLGGDLLESRGSDDVFVTKFDSCGVPIWSRGFGEVDFQLASSVGVDLATGDILLAGQFRGSIDWGGGPLTSAGGFDIFVARLDANGGHEWSRRYGDASEQYVSSLVPGNGGFALAGPFTGNLDLGGSPLATAGLLDWFAARFVDDPTNVGADEPRAALLDAVWPSPSRGTVYVSFTLPATHHVALEIFDVRGRRVRTLLDAGRGPGRHVITWDGYDARGAPSPVGVYVVRLAGGGTFHSRKVVRLE